MDQPSLFPGSGEPLSIDVLVEQVHGGFSAKNREMLTREAVRAVVQELNLTEERRHRPAPRLLLRRLRFTGAKHLSGKHEPEPINYNQKFEGGVNVILIPDNDVGKSSILKTIKYALTGDDSDYDADVREWIKEVWLEFSLDDVTYTSVLSTRFGPVRLVLVQGQEERPLDESAGSPAVLHNVAGKDEVRAALQDFFFSRLGLVELSWTMQPSSRGGEVTTCSTSWLTYFQALVMPDDGEGYLICDPAHAMGNQDGLIVSTFLGLRLTRLLNDLTVERDRARKEVASDRKRSEVESREAREQVNQLTEERRAVEARLQVLNRAQKDRRRAVEGGEPVQALAAAQGAKVQKLAEQSQLNVDRDAVNASITQHRALAERLRQAVALHLHFTGIDVRFCPNCDAGVDGDAVVREREAHTCRLCGKQAHGADAQEVAAMMAEAESLDERIHQEERDRERLYREIRRVGSELLTLENEITTLEAAALQGISYALPSPEEEQECRSAYEDLGRVQAQIAMAESRAEARPADESLDNRRRIIEKVREVLRSEAERRNQAVLERLAALTQSVSRRIGADSITDVSCSPLGRIQMRKNDTPVLFSGIRNPGERLRVKLAFFLAMMRLGREPGLGRHPGLLLIDQPGSAEMVLEDFRALAQTMSEIDQDMEDEVQVLGFTARPEFEAATRPSKVYRAQAGVYAF